MAEIARTWYYFGAVGGTGHNLYQLSPGPGQRRLVPVGGGSRHPLVRLDGSLVLPGAPPLVPSLTRLVSLGLSALAFTDYTVDTRPGSNSMILAPSVTIAPESIFDGFMSWCPEFTGRWPDLDFSRCRGPGNV